MPTKKEKENKDWEKEFEDKFPWDSFFCIYCKTAQQQKGKIKQFIHSLLKAQKTQTLQDLKEEVEKLKKPKKHSKIKGVYIWNDFNVALDAVKKLIEKYGK